MSGLSQARNQLLGIAYLTYTTVLLSTHLVHGTRIFSIDTTPGVCGTFCSAIAPNSQSYADLRAFLLLMVVGGSDSGTL